MTETEQVNELLDVLEMVIHQDCYKDGYYFSGFISAYGEGLRILGKYGRIEITGASGRMVEAKRVSEATA